MHIKIKVYFSKVHIHCLSGIEDSSSRFVKLQNVKPHRSQSVFALLNSILFVAINVIDIEKRVWFLVYQSQMFT